MYKILKTIIAVIIFVSPIQLRSDSFSNTRKITRDFMIEVAKGNVPGHVYVHKFGRNSSVSTSLVPVCSGGEYVTPTTAVSLEFVSGSAADALDDVGMHSLNVQGLDENWDLQSVTTSAHATDGTIAVAITGSWRRVFRAYVASSGNYATSSAGSHVGTITIRGSGGGTTYGSINLEGTFPLGQTLIGAYTIPRGYTGYILSQEFSSDISGTKTTNFYFFQRENADDVTSSYSGTMRVQNLQIGTQGSFQTLHLTYEGYAAMTDIGYLAKASAATDASAEFELLLIQDGY